MRNFSISVFLVVFPLIVFAQNIKVEGTVKDSLGNPLEMANVIAFKKGTNFLQSYSISDSKGNYKLNLEVNQEYTLKASYLGFDTQTLNLAIGTTDVLQNNIVLKESSESLKEVEITYEMPVEISGDTISYRADSFTNGTEKKLEDVLEKLPGVEIDDNGEIEVEGKKVEKVLVEGKTFFDGDSKLATQNIPANAVDRVQVLKNYNEVAGMRSVSNNEDDIAINIRLKKGKDKFWFGEVNGGGGVSDGDGKYTAKPKLFYYSPKKSVNLLADFNNIGETPFTRRDYFRFTGGLQSNMSSNGTNYNVSTENMSFLTAQNNRALEIESNFGAFNFGVTPNESLDLNGFAIVNGSTTDMFTQSSTTYNKTGLIDLNETESTQKSNLGMLKFKTVYKPSDDFHLEYNIFGKISKQTEWNDVTSTQRSADTYKEERPASLNQNFNIYYNLNPKNIFALELQYIYQSDKPLFNSIAETQPFDLIPSIDEETYDLLQNKRLTTSKFDGKIDYFYLLNQKSHLNVTFGTTSSSQKFKSDLSQNLEDGSEVNFEESYLNNDVKYNFTDIFIGLRYKIVEGIFTFDPGVYLHNYKIKDWQLDTVEENTITKILPDIYARLQFKSTESLRFNYRISSQFSDITTAAEGYVFNNYKSLYKGNRYIENSLNHRYNLSYFSFSMFSFTNINASLTYTKKVNTVKNKTELVGVDRVSYPINSDFADESFSGFFRYGKTYNRLKTNFRANLSHSIFNNIVNDEFIKSKTFTHSYQASVATKFMKAPNFEIGYQLSFAEYTATKSITNRPFANMEIVFLRDFILTADYSYYNYKNNTSNYKNEYSFLNSNLYYQKKDSSWEFKFSVSNITDNKSINTDSYNQVSDSNSTSLYFIQPRLWMFSVKYNL